MQLKYNLTDQFTPVLDHVRNTANNVICSGAACLVIHKDSIVLEEYFGHQSNNNNARLVQEDSQFHVASVRKSYIGFAVAYAVYHGYIESIDDVVIKYLPELDENTWAERLFATC